MNEGRIPVQSYLDLKNHRSISDWQERAWQHRSTGTLMDPRDQQGMRSFHNYRRKLTRLHRLIENSRVS